MKTYYKIITILTLIVVGVFFIWYFQVYKKRAGQLSTPVFKETVIVSIDPLRYIVQRITDDDFNINVLVPPGASPETYEPTPRQLVAVSDAELFFTTGLIDFERVITDRISEKTNTRLVSLSSNILLLSDSCTHNQGEEGHHHGVDPHIWTSPRCLKTMADNAYTAIALLYPDSVRYESNHRSLILDLENLDKNVKEKIDSSGVKSFFIYHPALTYYANDYGVDQIALEQDGKEPSAEQLTYLITKAREDSVKYILYQKEFSSSVVKTVAGDIGASPIEFDPLAEDVISNIMHLTDIITR